MAMGLIVSFPGTGQAILSEVGGKGYSLIRMAEAGLPVPPGAVLTTEFFAPWIDAIRASSRGRSSLVRIPMRGQRSATS